jgi:hypothetical protein
MEWLPVQRHLKANADEIRFDTKEYVSRLLLKNGRSRDAKDFSRILAKRRSDLTGDPRDAIRGHDLTEVLSWAIRSFRGLKELASVVAVERIFLLAAPRVQGLMDLFPPPNSSGS